MAETTKVNHPKGLYVLFFTEMWERFGYYLMLGILFLYLTDTAKGGMGLGRTEGADIVGTYLGLVYLTPFLGGLIADRILGYRKSILIGGVLMSLGYFGLAIPDMTYFWFSVLLIIVGNGFFKPNISTLLGNLYSTDDKKHLKDSGYNIFYMGINLGAFICNFVAAYMRNEYGWGYAFAAAGAGMLFGVLWFLAGTKHIKEADIRKPANPEDMSVSKVMWLIFVPAMIFGAMGWYIPGSIFGSAQVSPALQPFGMVQEISTKTDSFPKYDSYFRAEKDVNGNVVNILSPNPYFQNLPKENWPQTEGKSLKLISTEIFQSVNPFFIILLTPLVISVFSFLRRRNAEPSTPAKIGYGLLITGASTLIMAAAVWSTDMTIEKASAWWLIGSYAVITIGELFLSPIGLSLVSKVSPPRITSLMMGGWFLATSIGNKLSGVLSSLWDTYNHKANFFLINFVACMIAGLIIFAMIKWLRGIINKHI